MLRWLFFRWRADRLRTLAQQAFSRALHLKDRGIRLQRQADDCDARAAIIRPGREVSR